MNQDQEHLNLLSIFHYVVGGLSALAALLPIIHLAIGIMFVFFGAGENGEEEAATRLIGWFFIIFPSLFILTGWVFAGCVIAAGRCLARRRRYMFCLVMAGVECIFIPLGTVLGVFTIIVLMRESVQALFGRTTTHNEPPHPQVAE